MRRAPPRAAPGALTLTPSRCQDGAGASSGRCPPTRAGAAAPGGSCSPARPVPRVPGFLREGGRAAASEGGGSGLGTASRSPACLSPFQARSAARRTRSAHLRPLPFLSRGRGSLLLRRRRRRREGGSAPAPPPAHSRPAPAAPPAPPATHLSAPRPRRSRPRSGPAPRSGLRQRGALRLPELGALRRKGGGGGDAPAVAALVRRGASHLCPQPPALDARRPRSGRRSPGAGAAPGASALCRPNTPGVLAATMHLHAHERAGSPVVDGSLTAGVEEIT